MQIPTQTYRAVGQVAQRLLIRRDEKLVNKCVG
jgi:hypothetical protein